MNGSESLARPQNIQEQSSDLQTQRGTDIFNCAPKIPLNYSREEQKLSSVQQRYQANDREINEIELHLTIDNSTDEQACGKIRSERANIER